VFEEFVDDAAEAPEIREMLVALLKDGHVDASVKVQFDIEGEEVEEGTCLHWACFYGFKDIVELLLLDENVDVQAQDECEMQPVHMAVEGNHFEILKMLLDDGRSDFHADIDEGWNPVSRFSERGDTETLRFILQNDDIDPTYRNEQGKEIIHVACSSGHVESILF
jgi:ankyrin repeat protein